MHWIERFDLFLLDFDGLLVDTERLHYEAYQILCRRYHYELPWDMNAYLKIAHSGSEGLRQAIFPHLQEKESSWDVLYAEKKKIYLSLLEKGKISLMPGIESFLKELARARIKRCVATHSAKEQIELIKHFQPVLKTIPVWITREDYEHPKPAPDAYLKAIEILADHGDRIIGFEDSLRGIQALQKTMALPVLICNPSHPQMNEASLKGVSHYPTIEQIPHSFKPN